jgi:hypothetical protein
MGGRSPNGVRTRVSTLRVFSGPIDLGWQAEIHAAGPFFWGDAAPTD